MLSAVNEKKYLSYSHGLQVRSRKVGTWQKARAPWGSKIDLKKRDRTPSLPSDGRHWTPLGLPVLWGTSGQRTTGRRLGDVLR